jgi:hypothetical protein
MTARSSMYQSAESHLRHPCRPQIICGRLGDTRDRALDVRSLPKQPDELQQPNHVQICVNPRLPRPSNEIERDAEQADRAKEASEEL